MKNTTCTEQDAENYIKKIFRKQGTELFLWDKKIFTYLEKVKIYYVASRNDPSNNLLKCKLTHFIVRLIKEIKQYSYSRFEEEASSQYRKGK